MDACKFSQDTTKLPAEQPAPQNPTPVPAPVPYLELNDSLDDLFGIGGEKKQMPSDETSVSLRAHLEANPTLGQPARPEYAPKAVFTEGCPDCRGTGIYSQRTTRLGHNRCTRCKGTGILTFKRSAADRAKDRESEARNKARRAAAFEEANKAEIDYMRTQAGTWEFARDLLEKLARYGKLTDGQMAPIKRSMQREAERQAQRAQAAAERALAAPAVDVSGINRLKAAFDTAIAAAAARGLKKYPKITIGDMTIEPAKATSTNPGALYVKQGATYLGKVTPEGRWFASRDCQPAQTAKIQQFIADPAGAAQVYGQETGTCCICNATLRSEWKHRGIGPICAQNFGF